MKIQWSVLLLMGVLALNTAEAADPCASVPARNPIAHTQHTTGLLTIGDTPGETVVIPAGTKWLHNGTIRVINNGSLLFDGGELHLQGNDTHIILNDNAQLSFRNGAHLHYEQEYVAQHLVYASGNSRILFSDATVAADGSTESVKLFEGARYTAVNTHYADWKTWYMHNWSSLVLVNVCKAGDVVFYNRPTMYAENVTYFMPWLHFGFGAEVDLAFPDVPDGEPVNMTLSDGQPGIRGIPWTIQVVNSTRVWWGLNPYPGSKVTIRDSRLKMSMMRFVGNGQYTANELYRNRSHYDDQVFPLPDRTLRLINTEVGWWKVDAEGNAELRAENLVISEMMNKGNSKAWVKDSFCECQTIHVGVQENAFLHFQDGLIWSYVSAWGQSALVLDRTIVTTQGNPYKFQTRNIAHNRARLYALNSYFEFPPEAADAALVMAARIAPLQRAVAGQAVSIRGEAWLESGPLSGARFGLYTLEYQRKGSTAWSPIHIAAVPVRTPAEDLAVWDTRALSPGEYTLRLTVLAAQDDTNTPHPTHAYPATVDVVLLAGAGSTQ